MILVFNSGSSTLKFQLFSRQGHGGWRRLLKGMVNQFGNQAHCCWITHDQPLTETTLDLPGHREAAYWALELVNTLVNTASTESSFARLNAVAFRVVHGGPTYHAPAIVTDEVLQAIREIGKLAPLHNPPAVVVIEAVREILPESIPLIAVFDTAFHHTIPDYAYNYGIPRDWVRQYGIRRYGFHGLAHRYLAYRYYEISGNDPKQKKVITLQLGNGCSVCAVNAGHSIDTSMGLTPLEGLVMSTRTGDIDPGILIYLLDQEHMSLSDLKSNLINQSGLLGLSDESPDMRRLLELEAQGHAGAKLAINAFSYRARKYVGSYLAALNGAEAIVFGGGIGENSPDIRTRICANMEWCGILLDRERNDRTIGTEARISLPQSRIAVYVIPVDEETAIATDASELLNGLNGN